MSRRKWMDRTSPSNRHSTAAANPPGALSESFTLAAAGILGQISSFAVSRVRSVRWWGA